MPSSVLLAVDALAGAAVLAYIALHVRRLKKRPKAVADLMDHQLLAGKDKWLGGVLGADGCIYGIPQCAVSVIKIDPKKQQVSTIGTLPGGGWKWHGGVTGPDGCIYGIPANADTVLKIDPMTQEVMTLPFRYTCHHRDDGKYKYLGGVLGPDGRIYCIPSDADRVLRIDPATNECVEIGETLEGRVDLKCNKWQNGFLARDGQARTPNPALYPRTPNPEPRTPNPNP